MKSYKDLEIYQQSFKLAIKAHRFSLSLPRFEMYEEGSQLRRSSKRIAVNIVEGYGRRRYKADCQKFLIYAQASCDETIVHLKFIRDTHETHLREGTNLAEEYHALSKKINSFVQYVDKEWR